MRELNKHRTDDLALSSSFGTLEKRPFARALALSR